MNLNELRREIRRLYKETDVRMKSLPKVCGKGCSSCCHQAIRIIAAEELQITYHLDNNANAALKGHIREQLTDWLDIFTARTPEKQELDERDIGIFISSTKLACPFLIEDECAVYDARPIVCRTHVVDGMPDLCRSDRLRDPSDAAKLIKDEALKRLYMMDPNRHIRLLAYAIADYFKVERKLKGIRIMAQVDALQGANHYRGVLRPYRTQL